MTKLETRIAGLEAAIADGSPDCPTCASRPPIVGPWSDREPDTCPRCGAPWTRWGFTLRLFSPRDLLDMDAQ